MPKPPVPNPHCQPGQPNDLLRARNDFLRTIRDFFHQRDFLEVETPAIIPCPDPSPHLHSFLAPYHPPLSPPEAQVPLFLRTSPEFAMKQLVAAGYPRTFQICKFFRNGEISPMHNPEFTGLEWYATHADYHLLMDLTEQMCLALWPDGKLHYQGVDLDLSLPWKRITVFGAMQEATQLPLAPGCSKDDLADACRTLQLSVQEDDAWDDLFFKIFLTFVEPKLGMDQPTFLMDYPIEMAALSRPKPDNPLVAERVELYIAGVELANGYSELTDPIEQTARWKADARYRQERGDPLPYPVDPGLINALEWGMPPTAGIAVGLDRLLMLQRNAANIADVLPFPLHQTPPFSEQIEPN